MALLGATGSGKTTIINLIPRFYDVSEGQVLIDGYDVRDVTIESLRRQIGIVLQETNLFTGTIRDNIAFGRPDASDEDVIGAAKAAAAHDFIMGFPDGYDTPVGERGTTLSGGQKQRIAIARALLLDPTDPDPGRLDQQRGRDHRGADPARAGPADGRAHQLRHRPAHQHRASMPTRFSCWTRAWSSPRGKHADLMETSAIYADIYRSQLVEDADEVVEDRAVDDAKRQYSLDRGCRGCTMIGGPRGLLDQETLKPRSVRRNPGPLWPLLSRPIWPALLVTVIMLFANAWVQVITPELMGQAVDCYFTPGIVNLGRRDDQRPRRSARQTLGEPTASESNCWFSDLPPDASTSELLGGADAAHPGARRSLRVWAQWRPASCST